MNRVVLMGRLTRDPDVKQSGETSVARYTLAVGRRSRDEADFISIVAFGKAAEFASKYLHKGMRICIDGRIQTGSYTNKSGVKVYTTDVVAEAQEFADAKQGDTEPSAKPLGPEGFMNIPDGIEEELPFH